MKKKPFIVFSVAALVFVLIGVGVLHELARRVLADRYAGQPQVLGLPAGYDPLSAAEPFKGLHPSRRERPEDSYPYPIPVGGTGPVLPTYTGSHQYPYACRTETSGLGQPVIDNQEGAGVAVYAEKDGVKTDEIAGYSKDCSLPTRVYYYYRSRETGAFLPFSDSAAGVDELLIDGASVPFVVRIEMGTINRHIYVIALLSGPGDRPDKPDLRHWNGKLIYQFRGGVGIGRRQGRIEPGYIPSRRADELAKGYAVAYSTANQTSTQYDIELQEDTVARVKRQFGARYRKPVFTIGIGGSGGAIQQYLIDQNRPGLLDAGIALMSYPDMITQTIKVMDCALLEYYFDVTDKDNEKWRTWSNRRWIEGFNALDGPAGPVAKLQAAQSLVNVRWPAWPQGQTECAKSWRTLIPQIVNPRYNHFSSLFAPEIAVQVPWTYWDNLKRVFGTDENGFARRTWDNVGVQYGLQALKQGRISAAEFIHLNDHVGGWKPSSGMAPERFWLHPPAASSLAELSVWGQHNMIAKQDDATPARRTAGDLDAIAAAYRSGQVFLGQLSMPVIDLRHYLESELDMHHSMQSFSVRLRMMRGQGHADNQLIWSASPPSVPISDAFEILERWLENIRAASNGSVIDAKPQEATDRCYNDASEVIASGSGVWDGVWNGKENGACMARYPIFSNSRIVAGDDYAGDVFKCHLQPVDDAIANGVYAPIDAGAFRDELRRVFPDGVCDYAAGDAARPADLLLRQGASTRGRDPE